MQDISIIKGAHPDYVATDVRKSFDCSPTRRQLFGLIFGRAAYGAQTIVTRHALRN